MKRLLQSLSLVDLSVLASSSMAPAYSIAAVMGLVVAAAGLGAPLALIISTIPIAFIATGFMRLSEWIPSAGAVYSWSRFAFGNRIGWFTAILIIIAYYFGTIATAVPAAVYSIDFVAPRFAESSSPWLPLTTALAGVVWIAFSTYFLIIGARPTAKLSAFFLGFELLALLVMAGLAFAHPSTGVSASHPAQHTGRGGIGFAGLIGGAVLSIWITAGWEISTYSSEESAKGRAAPGAGALIGLLGTAAIVLICFIAFLRVGTVDGFVKHQDDALAYVADRLGGGWTIWLMTATVLVSSAASLWTTMFTLARAMFAMGRDGVLPRWLGAVHPRFGSPWTGILAASIPATIIMLAAGLMTTVNKEINSVLNGSSIFLGFTFVIAGFACAWLYGRRARENPRSRGHSWPRATITGIVLPLAGAVLTLGLLIYNLVKVQAGSVQWFTLGGLVVAVLFAFVAGRWSVTVPAIPKEEAPITIQ